MVNSISQRLFAKQTLKSLRFGLQSLAKDFEFGSKIQILNLLSYLPLISRRNPSAFLFHLVGSINSITF